MVFNDNSEALEQAEPQAGVATDSLRAVLDDTPAPSTADDDYLVVSIADRPGRQPRLCPIAERSHRRAV